MENTEETSNTEPEVRRTRSGRAVRTPASAQKASIENDFGPTELPPVELEEQQQEDDDSQGFKHIRVRSQTSLFGVKEASDEAEEADSSSNQEKSCATNDNDKVEEEEEKQEAMDTSQDFATEDTAEEVAPNETLVSLNGEDESMEVQETNHIAEVELPKEEEEKEEENEPEKLNNMEPRTAAQPALQVQSQLVQQRAIPQQARSTSQVQQQPQVPQQTHVPQQSQHQLPLQKLPNRTAQNASHGSSSACSTAKQRSGEVPSLHFTQPTLKQSEITESDSHEAVALADSRIKTLAEDKQMLAESKQQNNSTVPASTVQPRMEVPALVKYGTCTEPTAKSMPSRTSARRRVTQKLKIVNQSPQKQCEQIIGGINNKLANGPNKKKPKIIEQGPVVLTLSSGEEEEEEESYTNKLSLLIYPPGKEGLPINTEDYLCLAQDQFLNDVIIDFYLKYLILNLPKEQQEKVHVFSTHFYERLTRRSHPAELDPTLTPAQKRHARVEKLTKSVNLFEKDFVIIPINKNSHWFLAIVCFPGMDGCIAIDGEVKQKKSDDGEGSDRDEAEGDVSELDSEEDSEESEPAELPQTEKVDRSKRRPIKQSCILIFDSLAGASRARVVATLRGYLTCEYKAKMGQERIFNKDVIKASCPKIPQQTNFTDCGLYLLQYVEQFFMDPVKDYHIPIKQLMNWFDKSVVTKKREDISLLIKKLMLKYNKDPSTLPDIAFPTLNEIGLVNFTGSEMSREEHPVDDTLINMITNLKPKIKSEMRSFDYDSPLKRSLSSSCLFDYVTPAKKIRADLIEARNNILSNENRMKEMQMFDNELHSLEQQLTHDRKAVEELELKIELAKVQNKFNMFKLTTDSLNSLNYSLIKELEKELTELKSDTTVEGDLKKDKVVSLRIRIEAAQEDAVKHLKSYQPN